MKFLVTGGAGFIGSAVVRYLINKTDHEVVNVDKLTYAGNLESLKDVDQSDRYSFEQADICNSQFMTAIVEQHQPDYIMHLAAESHVDRSISDPLVFIKTNIMGTATLLQVAKEHWKENYDGKLFYHVSTDEVYGDVLTGRSSENYPYRPSSPYAASKAASDHLVSSYVRTE